MNNSTIWVLVAGQSDAALCASKDGTSRLLRVISPKAQGESLGEFAWELMSELFRGMQASAFDGVVIIASPELMKEMRRVMIPEIRKLVVGEICHPQSEIARIRETFAPDPAAASQRLLRVSGPDDPIAA